MDTLETIATILIALPALLYATGCLFATQGMVDMLSERIPGLQMLVRALGVVFLGSAALINIDRFAEPAGWTMAGALAMTAFGVHLPDVVKDYPEDLGADLIDLEQRAAIAGFVKDLAVAGAAILIAVNAA